jgi:pSer/pThr/pTyr-binding forkhead associated (FHA) protein
MYCQECGQRLAPRGVAPTIPPIGLPPLAVTRQSSRPPPLKARPPRALPPTRPGEGTLPSSTDGRDGSPAVDDRVSCPLCGSSNARHLRFCITCGHLIAALSGPPGSPQRPPSRPAPGELQPGTLPPPAFDGAAAAPPLPLGASPFQGAPPIQGGPVREVKADSAPPSAGPPIPPSRVIELGTPAPEAMLRICGRCRGGSEPSSQFCRFCGAALSEGSSVSLAPRTPPPPPPPDLSPRPVGVVAGNVGTRPSPLPMRSTISMVSPQGPIGRARLVIIAQGGGEGPGHVLGETTDIGRTEGSVLVADDRYVSPRHARIAARAGGFYLRDLGSTNGIFFRIPFDYDGGRGSGDAHAGGAYRGQRNDQRNEPRNEPRSESTGESTQPILDQDLFLVGQQVLKFEVVKNAEEGLGVASEGGTLVFGTPSAPRYARLSQRTVEGVSRDVFHVQRLETIIGREVGDVVFTDDPFLSRRHAAIQVLGVSPSTRGQPRRFTLVDLGSSNGTFVQLREEIRLRNGDQFRIGQQLFRFDLDRTDA